MGWYYSCSHLEEDEPRVHVRARQGALVISVGYDLHLELSARAARELVDQLVAELALDARDLGFDLG